MKSQFSVIHFKYDHDVFIETGKIRSYSDATLSYMYHIYAKFNIKQFLLMSRKLRIQQF